MAFTPAPRLNVIAGDNGLGKSFLLDLSWWAVTRSWAGAPILPSPDRRGAAEVDVAFAAKSGEARLSVRFDDDKRSWRFPKGQPGQPGLVVYARVDGDFAVWDSNRRFAEQAEDDTGIPKGLLFDRASVWEGLRIDGKPVCNGLIADWVSWQQTDAPEFMMLCQALEAMSPSAEDMLYPGRPERTRPDDSRLIPTLRTPYGEEIPVTAASAGVRRILTLAYMLVWAWREHLELSRFSRRDPTLRMLVLIDEVELHLHPRWQRVILPAIGRALEQITWNGIIDPPTIQTIVTTHAPMVLASLEPQFEEPLDALFELDLVDARNGSWSRKVVLHRTEFQRMGDANAWLVSDIFGLGMARSLPAEQAINKAANLLAQPDRDEEALREVERELEHVLSDTDPFWRRWRAILEADPSDDPEPKTVVPAHD